MKIPGNQPIFYLWPIQSVFPESRLGHGGTQPYRPYQKCMGKCPLYGCNATGGLIFWEIHYSSNISPTSILEILFFHLCAYRHTLLTSMVIVGS